MLMLDWGCRSSGDTVSSAHAPYIALGAWHSARVSHWLELVDGIHDFPPPLHHSLSVTTLFTSGLNNTQHPDV